MSKYTYPNIPKSLILKAPSPNLGLSVCIPCYNEIDVITTVISLARCESISKEIEVIILINESLDDTIEVIAQNEKSYNSLVKFIDQNDDLEIVIYPIIVSQIVTKKAGVGYARRLAMDEAHRRFSSLGNDRGIIACLDADTTVSQNYFKELIKFFDEQSKLTACSIAFAHDLNIPSEVIKSAICDYESHLRYFINMQRIIELPFAYQTVGSAMAVTSKSYQKQGGMNTRKAGEDFYFLHKFIKNGLVGEINTAFVYPSSRVSDRVPFGTGKAVGDIINSNQNYETYNVNSFLEIDIMVKALPDIFEGRELSQIYLSQDLESYLKQQKFEQKIVEIKSNTTNYASFKNRFFQWFDAFRLMKCLHYLRDNANPDIEISEAIKYLFGKLDLEWSDDKYENLRVLRDYDKSYSMQT